MADETPAAVDAATVHQLKVTLMGAKPPIWRRLLVPSDITMLGLHDVVQIAMGWTDSHLHQFKVVDLTRGFGRLGPIGEGRERKARLAEIAPQPGDRLRYLYDFGDSWEHDIRVEAIVPATPTETYPRCVKGKRSGPPDDSGGIWGYANLVHALTHPNEPESAVWIEWIGPDFDPESFDLDKLNRQLAMIRPRRTRAKPEG